MSPQCVTGLRLEKPFNLSAKGEVGRKTSDRQYESLNSEIAIRVRGVPLEHSALSTGVSMVL